MDALMLDPHHDGPERVFPGDRQIHGHAADQPVNQLPDLVTVCLDLLPRGPIIMAGVQVIPGHLIHPYREHGFKARIDTGADESGNVQFVDKKGGGMPEVKDQRVTQAVGPQVKGVVAFQRLVQPFVDIKGFMKILEYLRALLLRISFVENGGSGVPDIHKNFPLISTPDFSSSFALLSS